MSDEKVLILRGLPPPPGTPVPNVIECLETLLARAKAGDIKAIAWTTFERDVAIHTGWQGAAGSVTELTAGIATLYHEFLTAVAEGRK